MKSFFARTFLLKAILFFCLLPTISFADQCQALTLEEGEAAVEYFSQYKDIVLWCACCDDDPKTYMQLVRAENNYSEAYDFYEIVLHGIDKNGREVSESIDLAYAHVVREGTAYCAGVELGCGADPCTKPFTFKVPDIKSEEEQWNFGEIQTGYIKEFTGYNSLQFPIDDKGVIKIPACGKWTTCVGFSADGKYIIAGGGYFEKQGELKVIHLNTGKVLFDLKGHKQQVEDLVVSPDKDIFISCDQEGKVIAWDYRKGEKLYEVKAHEGWIEGLAISADGKYFATAGRDKYACVWEVATGNLLRKFYVNMEIAASIAISPGNDYLVVGGISASDQVMQFDLQSGAQMWKSGPHSRWSKYLAYSPRGQAVFSAGDCDKNVVIIDAATGEYNFDVQPDQGCVVNLDLDPTGSYLAIASMWGISVYDLDEGTFVFNARTHSFPVESVKFSPDGKWLASTGRDGEVHLWQLVVR